MANANRASLALVAVMAVPLGAWAVKTAAQPVEQPSLPRAWRAAFIDDANDNWLREVGVDVVETSGACIYVIRTQQREGADGIRTHIINKKDLGVGKGC